MIMITKQPAKAKKASGPKLNKKQEHLIKTLKDGLKRGCRLVNFTYSAENSGEIAEHTVLMGIDLEAAYRRDRAVLCGKMAHLKKAIDKLAAKELLDSFNDSIRNGIGNNKQYTCKGVYKRVSKGVKMHICNNELILFGYSLKRKVLEPGIYPKTKSKPLTKAKNKLRKLFKCKRFRLFCLRNIIAARIEKKTIFLIGKA